MFSIPYHFKTSKILSILVNSTKTIYTFLNQIIKSSQKLSVNKQSISKWSRDSLSVPQITHNVEAVTPSICSGCYIWENFSVKAITEFEHDKWKKNFGKYSLLFLSYIFMCFSITTLLFTLQCFTSHITNNDMRTSLFTWGRASQSRSDWLARPQAYLTVGGLRVHS